MSIITKGDSLILTIPLSWVGVIILALALAIAFGLVRRK